MYHPEVIVCSLIEKSTGPNRVKIYKVTTVPSEIQWTSFFYFKMSLMISFRTEILHMHIINHRLIYNCMFEHLRMENKSGISCKIK